MTLVYNWPSFLGAEGVEFNQRGQGVTGPVSMSGLSQFTSIDTGYWIATLQGVQLFQGERVLAFRALRAALEGGGHHVRVPVIDQGQAPWPDGTVVVQDPLPFDDLAYFDDDAGFHQATIVVEVAEDAAAGATSLVLSLISVAALKGGEYFSIGDRLYVIKMSGVVQTATDEYTVAIWPRLREAVVAGASVEFDNPVCRMRLASEREMDAMLTGMWHGRPTVAFVEVLNDADV